MSFFVSNKLKGTVDESDFYGEADTTNDNFFLKLLDHLIPVKFIEFCQEGDTILCQITSPNMLHTLLLEGEKASVKLSLVFGEMVVKRWESFFTVKRIFKDKEANENLTFCEILINKKRGKNV